jgi:hypothetical protein
MLEYITIFSSILFVSNTYRLYFTSNTVYYYSFFALTLSSILHHALPHLMWLTYLDRFLANNVVFQGGREFYMYVSADIKNIYSTYSVINIGAFISVLYLYLYGYFTETLCWEKSDMAYLYHAILHICTTIGHHAIISIL